MESRMADLKSIYNMLKEAGLDPNKAATFYPNLQIKPEVIVNVLREAGFKPNKVIHYNIPLGFQSPESEKPKQKKTRQGGKK